MKNIILILLITLTGCASLTETHAQKVFAATQMYDVALSVAVAYKELPPCGTVILCSDADTVNTIQKADIASHEALTAAQNVVRSDTSTQSALQTAVMWAQGAVTAFSNIINSLKIK